MKRKRSKGGEPVTLVILRSSSGSVIHGPFTHVDHAAWVELEARGLHVEFKVQEKGDQ